MNSKLSAKRKLVTAGCHGAEAGMGARRAVRILSLSRRPLHGRSLADIQALRDREWEAHERGYHESAVADLNARAPYAVQGVLRSRH